MSEKNGINYVALLGVCLIAIPAFLDFTIVNTALPAIQQQFSASVLKLQWVTNIYAIFVAMLMIVVGRFGDIFGRRRLMYVGSFIFVIAALGGGFASSINWLIAFRALMGVGAAFLFILCGAVITETADKNHQQKIIAIYAAITGFGLAVGPFAGGILVSMLSWRWVMWVNVPFLLLGLLICLSTLRAKQDCQHNMSIDWTGFVLLLVGIATLVNGILNGSHYGWGHLYSWGLVFVGVLALIILFRYERKHTSPLLEMSVFSSPIMMMATINCIAAGFFSYVFFFFDPLYLNVIKGYDAFWTGSFLLAIPVAQVVLSFFSNGLIKKFGLKNLLLFSFVTAFLASICHAYFVESSSIWFMLISFVLMGITWGIANIGLLSAAHGEVPDNKVGGAIGTIATTWNISGSICLAIGSVVFYTYEKIWFLKSGFGVSGPGKVAVEHVLKAPTDIAQLSHHFTGQSLSLVTEHLKLSFLHGFHAIAILFSIVSFMLLLVALVLRPCKEAG